MAPTLDTIELVEIYPWPLFQAVIDGMPAIGAELFTLVPGTSTPKVSFLDPFLTTPNTNPVRLNDQGAATVYLDGNYDLRLYDKDGVLIWSVSNYTFSSGVQPSGGLVQWGSAEATLTAFDGASVLRGEGLVPSGYRLLGVHTEILQDFGTSRDLTGLMIGDRVLSDRFGIQTNLIAGTVTRESSWHSDTELVTQHPYDLFVSARGGLFDGNGSIRCRAVWQIVSTETIPEAGTPLTYGSAETTLTATDGASQLTASGLVPADSRIVGVQTTILSSFGTSRGLSALMIGDSTLSDRFGIQETLTASTESGQQQYHSDTQLIAFPNYTLLVAAKDGLFDANGAIRVVLFWTTITETS